MLYPAVWLQEECLVATVLQMDTPAVVSEAEDPRVTQLDRQRLMKLGVPRVFSAYAVPVHYHEPGPGTPSPLPHPRCTACMCSLHVQVHMPRCTCTYNWAPPCRSTRDNRNPHVEDARAFGRWQSRRAMFEWPMAPTSLYKSQDSKQRIRHCKRYATMMLLLRNGTGYRDGKRVADSHAAA